VKILSTEDISLEDLRDLQRELRPSVELEVQENQYFFKSAEPPSWIAFFADGSWWLKAFGAYAALYVAEIVKEAGKTTWKNRRVVAAAARSAGESTIRAFARALSRLRVKITPRTDLLVGLPVPDQDFGARLHLEATDQELLEIQLALFFHHLPRLTQLIRSQQLDTRALGPVQLRLLEDGGLEVAWLDSASERERRHTLPLDAA